MQVCNWWPIKRVDGMSLWVLGLVTSGVTRVVLTSRYAEPELVRDPLTSWLTEDAAAFPSLDIGHQGVVLVALLSGQQVT